MTDKTTNLFSDYVAGRMSRRELVTGAAKLGLSAAAAGMMLNQAMTQAMAANFDWQKYKGKAIKLLLNKHPYTDAMLMNIENFKKLTGLDVTYDVFPEDVYFDKVTTALSSKSSSYDAFMTGAYQTWQYGPAGWLVDLNEFIKDPAATSPDWNVSDILPGLLHSDAWSGVPGEPLGGPNAKQWALPWGFELNSIAYNKRMFEQAKVDPPKNLPDLIEKAVKLQTDVKGIYGVGVRGSRSWATIHPGYLSGLTSYGGSDFTVENGQLKSAVNSPQCKAFTKLWIEMIQKAGPKNWTNFTWYEVGNGLGAGASAMIFDADILGFFQQKGTKEAGNIGYEGFAANPDKKEPTPNVWIWSLAINAASNNKGAAWLLLQWAAASQQCLFGATKADLVDPVRQTVWDDKGFQDRLKEKYAGYLEQYTASAPGSKIYFTPQPLFFNLTTEWAASLQKMYANEVSVDEGLDKLAESVTSQLKDAGIVK
ncbi:MAG: extracellular solute-binding protein [Roseiarcus sp.]|jgi:multiple sugar transport system substrate-binding protein